jgi:hypothetical protein
VPEEGVMAEGGESWQGECAWPKVETTGQGGCGSRRQREWGRAWVRRWRESTGRGVDEREWGRAWVRRWRESTSHGVDGELKHFWKRIYTDGERYIMLKPIGSSFRSEMLLKKNINISSSLESSLIIFLLTSV